MVMLLIGCSCKERHTLLQVPTTYTASLLWNSYRRLLRMLHGLTSPQVCIHHMTNLAARSQGYVEYVTSGGLDSLDELFRLHQYNYPHITCMLA